MENKSSKYFKYAIGEIVLVVIGILIALQINNWNEARKERTTEINYLKNLKADLLDDIRNNEYFANYRFSKAQSATFLLNTTEPKTIEDAETYTNNYENVFMWEAFVPNNNTFKELLSSGHLSLIKNDSIKNALLELEKLYARISIIEHHSRREFEVFLYDVSVENTSSIEFFDTNRPNYGIPYRLTISDIPASKHPKLIKDTQWLYNDQTFNNGLKLAFMNSGGLAGLHQQTAKYIENMVTMIENEIKK